MLIITVKVRLGKGKKLPRGFVGPEAKEWVYKPSSVHASCDALCGHSSGAPVTRRLGAAYPGMITRRTTSLPLFGLAPDEVFPATCVTAGAVSSYLTISPLPDELGGIFSVALSVESPPLGVTQHPVLRSSDFPHRRPEDRQARPPDPLP